MNGRTHLQVATDMVIIPKMRMNRFSTRGISSSIPMYRRSGQHEQYFFLKLFLFPGFSRTPSRDFNFTYNSIWQDAGIRTRVCCDRSQVCYHWATHPFELHTSLWATHIAWATHIPWATHISWATHIPWATNIPRWNKNNKNKITLYAAFSAYLKVTVFTCTGIKYS